MIITADDFDSIEYLNNYFHGLSKQQRNTWYRAVHILQILIARKRKRIWDWQYDTSCYLKTGITEIRCCYVYIKHGLFVE